MKQGAIASGRVPKEVGLAKLALVGTPLVFAAYELALSIGHDSSLIDALPGSVANTIPAVLFGLIAFEIVRARLVGRRTSVQILAHAVLCAAYALLSYWLLIVLLGAVSGFSVIQFQVEPFPIRASVWQLLQNATTYGIIAVLAYRGTSGPDVTLVLANEDEQARPGRSRYFIRSGDEIQPIEVNSIVSITGADDYAEVGTLDARHLVRMTLAEFEKSLDPAQFIRVHRSRIVNVDRIARAEPAGGGRLLLHMEDGEAIPASRSGSRLLRERVI